MGDARGGLSRLRVWSVRTEHQGFREMCDDYQELAAWIDDHQSAYAGRKELADSLELLDSLAEEISRFLSADDRRA